MSVASEEITTTVSRILAPVDFSRGSEASADYAAAMAKVLHGAVTLLHVYQRPDLMESIVPGADAARDIEEVRSRAEERLETMRADTMKRSGVDVHALVILGSPAAEILSLAHDGCFDMVVMATHARTGVQRVLLGSVTEDVMRGSHCPVLTLHLPDPKPSV